MEITKELKDIKEGKNYLNTIIEDLEIQKEEIEKKIHLFKVVAIATIIEDFLNSPKENDIHTIGIQNFFDQDFGYKINFECFDKNGDVFIMFDENGNFVEPITSLKNAFYKLENYNSAYVGEDFKENASITFELTKGCEEKILDLLLSKELKTILGYSQLQNSVSTNNNEPKKPKI